MSVAELSIKEKALLLKSLCHVLKEHRKRADKGYSIRLSPEQIQLIYNKIIEIVSSI